MDRVVNKPETSIGVRYDGRLPTRLNLAGYQRVSQWVDLQIYLSFLFLQFVINIQTESHFHQPIIRFCMFCS